MFEMLAEDRSEIDMNGSLYLQHLQAQGVLGGLEINKAYLEPKKVESFLSETQSPLG